MRVIIFGDISGIPQLLRHLAPQNVIGVVGASIRPQYHEPLSEISRNLNVPYIVQPRWDSTGYGEFKDIISVLCPDLIWVNSYSMVIRNDVLSTSRLGGINIHAALLPRNRGCNPIQWAILNNETETGVTLHEITTGIDEGNIIDQRKVPVFIEDTWQSLRDRVAFATDELITDNLSSVLSGTWNSKPQVHYMVTYGRRRTPDDGLFDWTQPIIYIYNLVRALLPPLPPAFYVDSCGSRVILDRYYTPAEITSLKYGIVGGEQIRGERVRLRPIRKQDAPLLYEWITNRELVVLNSPYFPVSEDDHEAWMISMLTKRTDLVIFVIEELEKNQAIGTCRLNNINWLHRSAELQIRIGNTEYHGRGFGSEAVRLLCHFGFSDLNLHRIYLHVFDTNFRAVRCYEKSGFVKEGLLREAAFIDGAWVDVIVMGLIRHDA